eukprot:8149223-Pyramimonas_sp.AAC.1
MMPTRDVARPTGPSLTFGNQGIDGDSFSIPRTSSSTACLARPTPRAMGQATPRAARSRNSFQGCPCATCSSLALD